MSTRQRRAVLILVTTVAFAAKVFLALTTYGTNDVYTYERFGLWSRYFGADLYSIAPDLNHPPSMLHFLSWLLWLTQHSPLPFHFWLRFTGIVADVGTLWLVCRIAGARMAERSVFIAVLLIAIAPTSIMISGFHGNTDPVMIFCVILAVWLAGYQDRPVTGGLAYGMALCIKIVPVILVPVLFFSIRGIRKQIAFFAAALLLVAALWAPYFYQQPKIIFHHVFGYQSSYGLWGISWLLRELSNAWPAFEAINGKYSRLGTMPVMAAILVVSVVMNRLRNRPSPYAQVGMVFLVFFTLTSGFAVQYLAWLTPWITELGAGPVALFTVTGSVFLLVVYNYWNLGAPWYLAIAYPWSSHQYFQVLCWVSVVVLTAAAWRRMRPGTGTESRSARTPLIARIAIVAAAAGVVLAYPAYVHMRRDRLGYRPAYALDEVLYTQADELQNLAGELARRGRNAEAATVQRQSEQLTTRAAIAYDDLVKLQPARASLRTPEFYVNASLEDYNHGDFAQCVVDATESLTLRPGMPAAWNNISLCNAQLGNWDSSVSAAREALRIEPESEDVRENLDFAIAQQQKSRAGR